MKRKRVLVVDDSAAMRTLVTTTIEALGDFAIDEAKGGVEALSLLNHAAYDVILLDINMPDLHGLELLGFIRQNPRNKATPIILISTESTERDREKGLALGASAYVVKPFTPEELAAHVTRLAGP